jgi:hypothetical protein
MSPAAGLFSIARRELGEGPTHHAADPAPTPHVCLAERLRKPQYSRRFRSHLEKNREIFDCGCDFLRRGAFALPRNLEPSSTLAAVRKGNAI